METKEPSNKGHEAPPPTHILMDGSHPPRLHRSMERDYLGRRYHLQQLQPRKQNSPQPNEDPFWNGATAAERALVMVRDDMVAVVGRMVEAPTALALAILERAAEEDASDIAEFEATSRMLGLMPPLKRQKKDEEEDSDYSGDDDDDPMEEDGDEKGNMNEDEGEDESMKTSNNIRSQGVKNEAPALRRASEGSAPLTNDSESTAGLDSSRSEEEEEEGEAHNLVLTGAVVQAHPKKPNVRLESFVQAGGLKILSRWLMEASPVVSDAAVNPERKMEPILVPLLVLLSKIPFNLKAIKESRINKRIKSLRKELEAAGNTPQRTKAKAALEKLIEKWEVAAKELKEKSSEPSPPSVDPFADLQSLIDSRLKDLDAYNNDETTPPEQLPPWLAKFRESIAADDAAHQTKSSSRTSSTTELARREREIERAAAKERASHLKVDLDKAQKERRELLQKLRAVQQPPTTVTEGLGQYLPRDTNLGSNPRVQWLDGYGRTSRMRLREKLESVVVFHKEDIPVTVANGVGIGRNLEEDRSQVSLL